MSAAVARLAEADACGGVVTIMSLAALTQAEEQLAEGLEQQAAAGDSAQCTELGANQAAQAAANPNPNPNPNPITLTRTLTRRRR